MQHRRALTRALATLGTLALLVPANSAVGSTPSTPTGGPSLRLVASDDAIVVMRHRGEGSSFPLGLFVASPDGDFELHASRPDYDSPTGLEQWIDGGATKVALDPTLLTGWGSLNDFLHITMTDENTTEVANTTLPFCVSNGDRQRTDDTGPLNPRFPVGGCYDNPFMLGNVMGIDQGWATNVLPQWGWSIGNDLKDGTYTLQADVMPTYVDLFSFPLNQDSATISVTIETVAKKTPLDHAATPAPAKPSAAVPDTTTPDPSTVPDLVPLPSYGIWISERGRAGHPSEWLGFGADVWNKGPAPLVVEGYRQPGEATMDAFQYFTDATDTQVARADVGTMEYDARSGHQHWHLSQFAKYELLDESLNNIVLSQKEAFCLFPTDAIDLTLPRADWDAGNWGTGLDTACGQAGAIWIREVLEAGWGDTYMQYRPGQSFDITDLPNGKYFIRVTANPDGMVYEADMTNNVSLRRVIIRGAPGHRYVRVPAWHGIDTD